MICFVVFVGEACGKPSQRVPYSKAGFIVSGLSNGIDFKTPSSYGQQQINKIMKKAEDITFHLPNANPAVVPPQAPVAGRKRYKKILLKLVTEEKVAGCLSHGHQILEEDLEVCNFDLTGNEFNILTTQLQN